MNLLSSSGDQDSGSGPETTHSQESIDAIRPDLAPRLSRRKLIGGRDMLSEILGRDVDAFNLAARLRDRKAVGPEPFPMRFTGLPEQGFCLGYGVAGDHAAP